MTKGLTIISFAVAMVAAQAAAAQEPAGPQDSASSEAALRLTVDDAVAMAIDRNLDLAAARLNPQIGDTRVAAAAGAFQPTFTSRVDRNNALQPPANFLVPRPTRTDAITSNIGVTQKLPWFGTSYNVGWTATHTDSNSLLNSYNPVLESGLSLTVSQPLLRDLAIGPARYQLAVSRLDRDVADVQLREMTVQTTANVKSAYWNLVTARAQVEARRSALALAQELVRVNKVKVDVGDAAPLDLVAAQAEVAANEEQLIVAETAVQNMEDRLRRLILDTSDPSAWNVRIEPSDPPAPAGSVPDLQAAVANALRDRTDLSRARTDIERAGVTEKLAGNQRLPDVRVNASYLASGLGGTELLREGGFPGTIVGHGAATGFGSVLNQLLTGEYSTWAVGVSVSYPIGQAASEAEYAEAKLETARSQQQLKSAQARAIEQVRAAWRKIEMNARRMETTRAARELAEERLDAERKRFEVGISTNFLVIQAQRDLTQARTNELAALLAHNLALVEFEAVQQAAPISPSQAGVEAIAEAPGPQLESRSYPAGTAGS